MKKQVLEAVQANNQVPVVFNGTRREIELKVDISQDTVWATQIQIANIFGVERSVVTKHIRNIFKDKELNEFSVCAKFAHTADDGKTYDVLFYNLDVILSVGYRVNSKRAVVFRQWATKTLRDYLIKGYVLNEKRLRSSEEASVKELQKTIKFIQETIQRRKLDQSEVDSVLSVITGYTNSWLLLHQYDEGTMMAQKSTARHEKKLTYEAVRPMVAELKRKLIERGEAGELFGNERNESFRGVLSTLYQTFDGKELYASREEKAAHLLYLVIKDHPFSDGNKRIGSFLFIIFLERNTLLYRKNGEKKINDNALVALALLIAQSNPKEKEQMIILITQLLK